ncbi:hypothetical protein GTQ99_08270 [Kineococcus sp. T13]|nr:hypothetical protein [Kineococcus vitellinus]
MRSGVAVRVLGALEVGSSAAAAVLSPTLRTVLAALVVDAGRVVPAAVLAERVWEDGGLRPATSTLHSSVSRLRRLLEPGAGPWQVLLTRAPGYQLALAPEALDAARFEQLLRRALAPAGSLPAVASARRRRRGAAAVARARLRRRGGRLRPPGGPPAGGPAAAGPGAGRPPRPRARPAPRGRARPAGAGAGAPAARGAARRPRARALPLRAPGRRPAGLRGRPAQLRARRWCRTRCRWRRPRCWAAPTTWSASSTCWGASAW